MAAQRLADEAALAARQANSVEQMAGRSEILSDVHHALPAGTTVKTRSRWTGSGSEYDSASNSGSEASWVEHTERRVITDVTRSETTRVGGSAAASAIMDSSATAEFRIYPPALASTSANQTRDSRSVASSRLVGYTHSYP